MEYKEKGQEQRVCRNYFSCFCSPLSMMLTIESQLWRVLRSPQYLHQFCLLVFTLRGVRGFRQGWLAFRLVIMYWKADDFCCSHAPRSFGMWGIWRNGNTLDLQEKPGGRWWWLHTSLSSLWEDASCSYPGSARQQWATPGTEPRIVLPMDSLEIQQLWMLLLFVPW